MIRIDTNRVLIEPFFDGGDSYTGHSKYSYIAQYRTSGQLTAVQIWDSALLTIAAGGKGSLARTLPQTEDLTPFDTVTAFLSCPKDVAFRLFFDGECVMDTCGAGEFFVHAAPIHRSAVSEIRIEIENRADREQRVNLYYIGADAKELPVLPMYTGTWEGCFADGENTKPLDSDYYTEAELEALRQRVRDGKEPGFEEKRKRALSYLDAAPEKEIAKTIAGRFRLQDHFLAEAQLLAYVGTVCEDGRMTRMACRYMLCMAACQDWCSDPMENAFPLVWHHRSFDECSACYTMSYVLSLCGHSLTWHGRNVLYQALIMKGLPRIEADLMTMEYIYSMNQGFAFSYGYVRALITLSHVYPRYEKRIDEAETLLFEMLDRAQNEDGSTDEGAAYWEYSFSSALLALVPLARRRGMDLRTYLGGKLDRTAAYGLFLLDSSLNTLTVSDSHGGKYSASIAERMAEITKDERWLYVLDMCRGRETARRFDRPVFEEYPVIGMTSYVPARKPEEIRLICLAGKSNSTHCHQDKGSVILYKGGVQLLCDRGALSYDKANGGVTALAQSHNVACPVTDAGYCVQKTGAGYGAPFRSSCENGKFVWEADLSSLWDETLVKSDTRRVESEEDGSFVVTDTFEFYEPTSAAVCYQITAPELIRIDAVSGIRLVQEEQDALSCPHETGNGKSETVFVRRFLTEKAEKVTAVTKITVLS